MPMRLGAGLLMGLLLAPLALLGATACAGCGGGRSGTSQRSNVPLPGSARDTVSPLQTPAAADDGGLPPLVDSGPAGPTPAQLDAGILPIPPFDGGLPTLDAGTPPPTPLP